MDVMKELVYYCEQDNPVGALLLTGEWGCGKTYLLDNDFIVSFQFHYNPANYRVMFAYRSNSRTIYLIW